VVDQAYEWRARAIAEKLETCFHTIFHVPDKPLARGSVPLGHVGAGRRWIIIVVPTVRYQYVLPRLLASVDKESRYGGTRLMVRTRCKSGSNASVVR